MAAFHTTLRKVHRRLIDGGHRVAFCDQMGEVPIRGLVQRSGSGHLAGDACRRWPAPCPRQQLPGCRPAERDGGLASVDVSTGESLGVAEVRGSAFRSLLAAELVRLRTRPNAWSPRITATEGCRPSARREAARATDLVRAARAAERLRTQFQSGSLASLGLEERPLAARAAAALLEYVERDVPRRAPLLDRLEVYAVGGHMVLDAATRRSLELTKTCARLERSGSLLAPRPTRTAMGARQLRGGCRALCSTRVEIEHRHDAVRRLVDVANCRSKVLTCSVRCGPGADSPGRARPATPYAA